MKVTKKGWLIIGLIIVGIGIILLLTIWSKWKRANTENDTYINYQCLDFHLVALNQGDCVGYYDKVFESGTDRFYYYPIKDASSDDFIGARRNPFALFSPNSYLVLQAPEKQIDVFNDWNMKKIQLYSCESTYWGDTDYKQKAVEDWRIQVLESSTDEALLQQVQDMPLNVTQESGTAFKNEDGAYECLTSEQDIYLRILFDESKYIAWDAPIRIYQSKTDEQSYVVTIYVGNMDEDFELQGAHYALDPSSELYQWVVDVYLG